jgi:hypothetical protein
VAIPLCVCTINTFRLVSPNTTGVSVIGMLKYFIRVTCFNLTKGKGHPITGHQGPRGGIEVELYSFSPSALGRCGWSAQGSGRFVPGKDLVPIVQDPVWAPGPVWTCAKNLAPTGIFFYWHIKRFDPRTVQPVVSRYTDWATRSTSSD